MAAVLELEVEILVQTEVGDGRIHVVAGIRVGRGAELIPLEIELEPGFQRDAGGHIESIGGTALLLLPADGGGVLGAEGPVVLVVIADAVIDALALVIGVGVGIYPVALPAENAELEARHGLHLDGTYDIFLGISVSEIDALAVVEAQLVMQQGVAVPSYRQQVTLDLDTLVTAAHIGFAETVAHAGHLLDQE